MRPNGALNDEFSDTLAIPRQRLGLTDNRAPVKATGCCLENCCKRNVYCASADKKPERFQVSVVFNFSLRLFLIIKHAKIDVSGFSFYKFFDFYATGVNLKLLRRLQMLPMAAS